MLASGFLLRFWMFSKWHSSSTRSRLFSPCVLGHGDMLRTRDEEGQLALECTTCGSVKRVLDQPTIRGPKHHAGPVKGTPVLKVTSVRPRERSYPRSA
jgi:hypothetical protein